MEIVQNIVVVLVLVAAVLHVIQVRTDWLRRRKPPDRNVNVGPRLARGLRAADKGQSRSHGG